MDKLPRWLPMGRLDDLRERADAHLIAYTVGRNVFDDYRIARYKSREALESFCKDGSEHHALIKVPTCSTRLTNANTQRPWRSNDTRN